MVVLRAVVPESTLMAAEVAAASRRLAAEMVANASSPEAEYTACPRELVQLLSEKGWIQQALPRARAQVDVGRFKKSHPVGDRPALFLGEAELNLRRCGL